ncbi:hypothetical protein SI65_08627 [Aspergillus cristatus]|uniref:Uncharacterized protein n=1 Tax=Aspergillus cristatus TaxID=573508 RepID=A0A1E3B4C5_ASPCR|nr:hypothetical protein SI65_08627 [Aspergillus cristatus]
MRAYCEYQHDFSRRVYALFEKYKARDKTTEGITKFLEEMQIIRESRWITGSEFPKRMPTTRRRVTEAPGRETPNGRTGVSEARALLDEQDSYIAFAMRCAQKAIHAHQKKQESKLRRAQGDFFAILLDKTSRVANFLIPAKSDLGTLGANSTRRDLGYGDSTSMLLAMLWRRSSPDGYDTSHASMKGATCYHAANRAYFGPYIC